jgi:hypothetical protein
MRFFFSPSKRRDRIRQAVYNAERSILAAASLAAFRAHRLALRAADEQTAARSPAEKTEAQSNSHTERAKFTPSV